MRASLNVDEKGLVIYSHKGEAIVIPYYLEHFDELVEKILHKQTTIFQYWFEEAGKPQFWIPARSPWKPNPWVSGILIVIFSSLFLLGFYEGHSFMQLLWLSAALAVYFLVCDLLWPCVYISCDEQRVTIRRRWRPRIEIPWSMISDIRLEFEPAWLSYPLTRNKIPILVVRTLDAHERRIRADGAFIDHLYFLFHRDPSYRSTRSKDLAGNYQADKDHRGFRSE